jgi:hypothetical protein
VAHSICSGWSFLAASRTEVFRNFLTTWRHPNKWQISGKTYRRVGGEMDGWANRRIARFESIDTISSSLTDNGTGNSLNAYCSPGTV